MKKLESLKWNSKWVTHLGCIKGCLKYLNMNVSDAWLYGATGHAFIINIHEVVCPSGPTAWRTEMLFKLGRNVGYNIEGVISHKSADDFAEKQRLAHQKVMKAIDEGLPCYGWELDIPEYYVVHGYDEEGYYYRDLDNSEKGPKPWKKLGDTGIGVLEMYVIKPGKAAEDHATVRESFRFVLEHSQSPSKWIYPKYRAGLAGFDAWIGALETGKADEFGNAYNAAVWNECRHFVPVFLREAKERLNAELDSLFDEAIVHYEEVARNLKEMTKVFPFTGPNTKGEEVRDTQRVKEGLSLLKTAKEEEASGLRTLEELLKRM
nr:hypothetical protein [Candidatus Njordarchaeum guaymaensis]